MCNEEINKPNKRIKGKNQQREKERERDRGAKKKLLLRGTVKKFKLVKAW